MWKHLSHPNIVPLLGITPTPLQLISEWIPGGDLTEYVRKHPTADRVRLVSVRPTAFGPTLTHATSYLMSLMASTTCTLVT